LPQASLRERDASDADAHARRLPGDPAFLCDRFGRGDDAACDETWPAFVLAPKDEDRIAFGDVLATYIVFCALNTKVFSGKSLTSALMANIMLLISHHYFHGRPCGQV
jgi:hypothetical protein